MPEQSLPISAAHREFTVKIDGVALSQQQQLLACSIRLVCNKIASARLVYLDGAAASSDFPLSNSNQLNPGKTIEILAGAEQPESLFKGIIVSHNIRIRDHSAPQLIIECRHPAIQMSGQRRSAYFYEKSDSDIFDEIIARYSIELDSDSTQTSHKQMVQYHCSDWDFVLSRAHANGLLIWPDADKLAIKAPTSDGDSLCTLQFGSTLLEFDGEINTRQQYPASQQQRWDYAQQAMEELDSESSNFKPPGNLSDSELANVCFNGQKQQLIHSAINQEEAQNWANATALRNRINLVSGRAKCEGIASIKPGKVVTLDGVGQHFNGKVFVSAVRHEFDLVQGWKSHIQFGNIEQGLPDNISTPAAGQLLAPVNGLQIGVVTDNEDPDGEHRVCVRLVSLNQNDDGVWARVASLDAGDNRGCFFRPEIGDEVVLGFQEQDPRYPIILGMLNSSAKAAPLQGSNDNHLKVIQTRSEMKVAFDDENKVLSLETPAGNSLKLSEQDQAILIVDQNNNKITLNQDGITIESCKDLILKATNDVTIEGVNISASANASAKIEGSASSEISSSGNTVVKGSMVQIN